MMFVETLNISSIVRSDNEEAYDFINSLNCPLTAATVNELIPLSIFIAGFKCPECYHFYECGLRKTFNISTAIKKNEIAED